MIAKSPSKRIRTSSATSPLIVTGCATSLRYSALSSSEPSGFEIMKSSAKISSRRFTSPFCTDAKKSRFRAVSVSRSRCAFAFVCMAISSGVRRFHVHSRKEALIFDPQEFNTDWDFRDTGHEPSQLRFDACECHVSSPLLAHSPGLAKRPERNPEQGQVLDEEVPRARPPGDVREGGEATETWLPDARRRDEEAQSREEHPHRQGATEGRNPRQERAGSDEQCDGDLDHAEHGREASDAQGAVDPTQERAVGDERTNPFGLVRRELHQADPPHHDHQAVAGQLAADRFHSGTYRTLLVERVLH